MTSSSFSTCGNNWFTDMPYFPIWDGDDDGDGCQDACDEAWANAMEAQAEWDAVESELNELVESAVLDAATSGRKGNTSGLVDRIKKLTNQLETLGQIRNAAYDAAEIACECD